VYWKSLYLDWMHRAAVCHKAQRTPVRHDVVLLDCRCNSGVDRQF
jgi:hypothetical protein